MIGTLQNSVVSYSTLQLTYLLIVGIATQAAGIYIFWFVQKRYQISTKAVRAYYVYVLRSYLTCRQMLLFVVFWILLLTIWGLAGVHSDNIGFKHIGEIWAYQAYYGLVVCPWYAYSQTMIAEVSPLPQMRV